MHATRRLLVAALTLALVGLLAPAIEAKARFRALTFNVRFDFPNDGANRWARRVDLVAQAIRASQAHVVCIQEDKEDQVADLAERLPEYEFVGRGRNENGTGERCSIAFSKEWFQLVESGDFWLSDTPDVPGSNTWGDRYPRKVTWALLDHRGTRVLVLNTHLPEGDDEEHLRVKATQLIHRWLVTRLGDRGARRLPVVVTGDFNADEDSPPYAALVEGEEYRLRDAWKEASPDVRWPGTYHGFRGMTTRSRIDWILIGGPAAVLQAGKHEWQQDGRYPSDHYPVFADIEVR